MPTRAASKRAAAAASALRVPDVWHGGVLQAIANYADEAALLRMTMLSASIRWEMSEPSFKATIRRCKAVRLDLALTGRDFDVGPAHCVGEGQYRWALVMPFMRYAGEVCEELVAFSPGFSSYAELLAICKLCPRLRKLRWLPDAYLYSTAEAKAQWPSKRVRDIAHACPMLEEVWLRGGMLASLPPHFPNLRKIEMGHNEGELTPAADAAVCKFLKARSKSDPGITLDFVHAHGQFKFSCSEALIDAVGNANVTEVSVDDCEFDLGSFRRMLEACTSLKTFRLKRFMPREDSSWEYEMMPAIVLGLVTASPSITELDFDADWIADTGAFLAGLTCLKRLEKLKLTLDEGDEDTNPRLTPAAVDVLLARANFPKLVELQLNITPDTGVDMVETLQRIVDARPALRILTVNEEYFPEDALAETFVMPFEATLKERGGEFRFEEGFDMDCD